MNRLWLLAWNGKLPPLQELLSGETPAANGGRQTGKQIAAALHVLADTYGLKVTKEARPHVH